MGSRETVLSKTAGEQTPASSTLQFGFWTTQISSAPAESSSGLWAYQRQSEKPFLRIRRSGEKTASLFLLCSKGVHPHCWFSPLGTRKGLSSAQTGPNAPRRIWPEGGSLCPLLRHTILHGHFTLALRAVCLLCSISQHSPQAVFPSMNHGLMFPFV